MKNQIINGLTFGRSEPLRSAPMPFIHSASLDNRTQCFRVLNLLYSGMTIPDTSLVSKSIFGPQAVPLPPVGGRLPIVNTFSSIGTICTADRMAVRLLFATGQVGDQVTLFPVRIPAVEPDGQAFSLRASSNLAYSTSYAPQQALLESDGLGGTTCNFLVAASTYPPLPFMGANDWGFAIEVSRLGVKQVIPPGSLNADVVIDGTLTYFLSARTSELPDVNWGAIVKESIAFNVDINALQPMQNPAYLASYLDDLGLKVRVAFDYNHNDMADLFVCLVPPCYFYTSIDGDPPLVKTLRYVGYVNKGNKMEIQPNSAVRINRGLAFPDDVPIDINTWPQFTTAQVAALTDVFTAVPATEQFDMMLAGWPLCFSFQWGTLTPVYTAGTRKFVFINQRGLSGLPYYFEDAVSVFGSSRFAATAILGTQHPYGAPSPPLDPPVIRYSAYRLVMPLTRWAAMVQGVPTIVDEPIWFGANERYSV